MSGPRLSVRPSLPPSLYLRRPAETLPWPLEDSGVRLYARARHGLWHGLKALRLDPGDELLVPAYHHGSEVEAIVQAGLRCRFYETPSDLAPDANEIQSLLDAHPKIRGLFLIHYLGFPQESARWRQWCDERDLLLIDDSAQAFLASSPDGPVGRHGDLAVFCIYKTYGVIDGAAMICSAPPDQEVARRRTRFAQTIRRNGAWLAQRSASLSSLRARLTRTQSYSIATDFGLGEANSAPSTATKLLLSRTLADDAAARRRDNYRFLLQRLEDVVPESWKSLPKGACPFTFPVESSNKESMFNSLQDEGVIALNLWSVPHPTLDAEKFAHAKQLRDRVLGLPVHQELRRRDLERIVDVFRRCERSV